MKRIKSLAAFAAIVASCGCSSVLHGSRQKLFITTTPEACTVSVDGGPAQLLPCDVYVTRSSPHILRLEKEGFKPATITTAKKFDPITVLDCLFPAPGFIGAFGFDFITGAAWMQQPSVIAVTLEPAEPAESRDK
jgi:hypothetical protein